MSKALVLYHANCKDGFGAAWAFQKFAAYAYTTVEYQPVAYGDKVEYDKTDAQTDVFILDFSFEPNYLVSLANRFKFVELIDHHKTAVEAWQKYVTEDRGIIPQNLHVQFDMAHSGAMLAYKRCTLATGKTPLLLLHIQDYDLWKFEHANTKSFIAHLDMIPKTMEDWNSLHDYLEETEHGYNQFVTEGKLLLESFESTCQAIIQSGCKSITIGDHKGLGCNAPGMFASRIGNILAERSGTFGATWFEHSSGSVKFSLRSEGSYDVSNIARTYGGGGHRNAAGFSIEPTGLASNGVMFWKTEETDFKPVESNKEQ